MEIEIGLADLFTWPLTLPGNAFAFVLEQIRDAADHELYDPQVVQQRLVELQLLYESGELSAAEYESRWADLFRRLAAIGTRHVLDD